MNAFIRIILCAMVGLALLVPTHILTLEEARAGEIGLSCLAFALGKAIRERPMRQRKPTIIYFEEYRKRRS